MALTAAQQQRMILLELGLQDDPTFDELVSLWWDEFADKAVVAPRLQRLYVKRTAVQTLITRNWELHDAADEGVKESFRQQIQNLEGQVQELNAQIETLENQARASHAPGSGRLTTASPIAGDALRPDPNSRVYRGDPLCRPGFRR